MPVRLAALAELVEEPTDFPEGIRRNRLRVEREVEVAPDRLKTLEAHPATCFVAAENSVLGPEFSVAVDAASSDCDTNRYPNQQLRHGELEFSILPHCTRVLNGLGDDGLPEDEREVGEKDLRSVSGEAGQDK